MVRNQNKRKMMTKSSKLYMKKRKKKFDVNDYV